MNSISITRFGALGKKVAFVAAAGLTFAACNNDNNNTITGANPDREEQIAAEYIVRGESAQAGEQAMPYEARREQTDRHHDDQHDQP